MLSEPARLSPTASTPAASTPAAGTPVAGTPVAFAAVRGRPTPTAPQADQRSSLEWPLGRPGIAKAFSTIAKPLHKPLTSVKVFWLVPA